MEEGVIEQEPQVPTEELIERVEPLPVPDIDLSKIAPTREERLFLVLSIFIGVISGLLVVSALIRFGALLQNAKQIAVMIRPQEWRGRT